MDQINPEICQTCGAIRTGKFCSACGEKKFSGADLSLKKYLLQGVDAFTHFEGKFFQSFRYLLFYPGKLTAEYISGRRVKLMKPLQLYVIVGIAFFFFFKNWDIFFDRLLYVIYGKYIPATGEVMPYDPDMLKGLERTMRSIAESKASAHDLQLVAFITKVDEHLPGLAKVFAFLMIPLLSLFIYLVGFRRQPRYVAHLVHATHLFTFLLAAITIWVGAYQLLANWFHWKLNFGIAFIPVGVIFCIYLFLSLRKLLPVKAVVLQVMQTLAVMAGLLVVILAYRIFIGWLALWLE